MNNSSDYLDDLLAGFASGTLDPDELEILTQSLATHTEWQDKITDLEETMEIMLNGLHTPVEPPPQLGIRIQNAVRAKRPLLASGRGLRSWQGIAGSVAAILILGLGWHSYQLQLTLQNQQEIVSLVQLPGSQLYVLQGRQTTDQAQGSILVNLEQQRAVIALHNMPTAPAGSVYRLWSIVGSKPHPCRDALPISNGKVVDEFSVSRSTFQDLYDPEFSGFKVTLEASARQDLQRPQGPVVLESI